MKPVASEPKKKKKKEFNPSSNLTDSDHKVGTDISDMPRRSLDGISTPRERGAELYNRHQQKVHEHCESGHPIVFKQELLS